MGRFLLGVGILAFFLTAGLCINSYISNTCDPIERDLALAAVESFEKAEALTAQAAQKWQEKRPLLAVFFDHAPLSAIDEDFAQLAVCRDEDAFFTTCAALEKKLCALSGTHKPTIENIL